MGSDDDRFDGIRPRRDGRPPLRTAVVLGCLAGSALALGGCAAVTELLDLEPPADEPGRAEETSGLDRGGLGIYLEAMRDLIEGDTVTQAETFEDAVMAVETAPTMTNRLRLALALATPGHPGSDAGQAQRELGQLLAARGSLLPDERVLAAIHLHEVEQRLILDARARQLQQEAAAAIAAQETDNARRLQAALEENRRLQAALEDAQQKLDAITSIERSIRERDNGAEPP